MKAGDPEMAGFTFLTERGDNPKMGGGSSLDSTQNNGEVVLVRWTKEVVRRKHEEEADLALRKVRGGAADYVDGASAQERFFSGGRPTRFRRSEHGLEFESREGNTVDVWQPDQGIIRSDS